MGSIQVKKATIEHVHIVQRIGRETFSETFADSNSAADMNRYLEDSFNEHQVRTELSNPDSLFFIAWDDEDPVGYLKLNSGGAQTEKQDHSALEIERIYVKSSHHGKTVGQLLYEKSYKNSETATHFLHLVGRMGKKSTRDKILRKKWIYCL